MKNVKKINNYNKNVIISKKKKYDYLLNLNFIFLKLNRLFNFLFLILKQKKNILFIINNKITYKDKFILLLKKNNCFFLQEKLIGGFLTNYDLIRKNILKKKYQLLTKQEKEVLNIYEKPDVIFIFNSKNNLEIIHDAQLLNIPVICFLNLEENLLGIMFPIIINDRIYSIIFHLLRNLYLNKS